jgi:meiotically up-regulated gene 157 (Mug157) protein
VEHKEFGKIYAFEVDGLGHHNLMDDANVPSLLSIPYLGWDYDPEIYANTRRFILSPANPWYQYVL